MAKQVKICIIPCAGEGTRWHPLSTFIPKEMIPFGRRPVVEWSIKEAAESGCTKIVIIINKRKKVIKNYILEHKSSYPDIEFYFVYQNNALGIVDSILKAKKYIKNEAFAVLYPDTPSTYKIPPLKQMIEVYQKARRESYILPFAEYPKFNLLSYGECLLSKRKDKLFDVLHICPRPKVVGESHHLGNKYRLAGREIFPKNSIKVFTKIIKKLKDKPDDGDVLNLAIAGKESVIGVKVKGVIYEVGNIYSYMESYLKLNKVKHQKKYW